MLYVVIIEKLYGKVQILVSIFSYKEVWRHISFVVTRVLSIKST